MKEFKFIDVRCLSFDEAAKVMFAMGVSHVTCNLSDYINRGYKSGGVNLPVQGPDGYHRVTFEPSSDCPSGFVFGVTDDPRESELDKAMKRIAELEDDKTELARIRGTLNERCNRLEHALQSIEDLTKRAKS